MVTTTLREARVERGLGVRRLALVAGVSEATVYRIERGVTTPRPHAAYRLAAVLGLPPEALAELRRSVADAQLRPPTIRAT